MKSTIMTITFIAIVAIVAGGVWALRQPAEARVTRPPAKFVAPEVKLAPGEADTDGRLVWMTPDGSTITLALIARGEQFFVRAYTPSGSYDVTEPDAGDSPGVLRITKTGVAWVEEMVVGREPEVGAISAYWITRLEWVPSKKQLAAIDTWSCDESEQQKPCEFPDWAKENLLP
jgi:hypothetical protein